MANKYANLIGTNKVKDDYKKINTGFDKVEADINDANSRITAVDNRVDTIITTPIDGEAAAQELVDARAGFSTIGGRMTNIEEDIETHKADNVSDSDGVHGLKVESGTFTPTIFGSTTAGNNTYTINAGFYEKIGRTVIFHIFISMTAKDPGMAGYIYVGGLPFTSYAQSGRYNSITIGSFTNITTGGKQLGARLQDNKSYITLYLSGNNVSTINVSDTDINNGSAIFLSGTYQTV